MFVELALFAATAGWLIWLTRAPDPPQVFGKYRLPGPRFWIKYGFMRLILYIRKLRSKSSEDSLQTLRLSDRPQKLSEHPLAFDAVFFMASNEDGFYLAFGSERRQKGINNGFAYVMIPGMGLLRNKKLPDMVLFGGTDDCFGAEGLTMKPMEALRKWQVDFEGRMVLEEDPTREFDVHVKGVWTSHGRPFNFDSDIHPHCIASMMAVEPWSGEYFETLKRTHQSHYEQAGRLEAAVTVSRTSDSDSTPSEYVVHLMSIRDHSFGHARDFDLLHRFVNFFFCLEDDTIGCVYCINHPCTSSMMYTGYVVKPSGEMDTLEWCDFLMYQHGEGGTPPKDLAFSFKAGGLVYRVRALEQQVGKRFIGWRWEALLLERFMRFQVDWGAGEVAGGGVSEFHYHSSAGRDPALEESDPAWFRTLVTEAYSRSSTTTSSGDAH